MDVHRLPPQPRCPGCQRAGSYSYRPVEAVGGRAAGSTEAGGSPTVGNSMKTLILIAVALLIAFLCMFAGNLVQPVIHEHVQRVKAKAQLDIGLGDPELKWCADTNTWLKRYSIWACDDGTFQVRTDTYDLGHFATEEEARARRQQRAEQMVQAYRAGVLNDAPVQRLPDCGKRIQ